MNTFYRANVFLQYNLNIYRGIKLGFCKIEGTYFCKIGIEEQNILFNCKLSKSWRLFQLQSFSNLSNFFF